MPRAPWNTSRQVVDPLPPPLHRISPRCRVTLHLSVATTGGMVFLSTFDEDPIQIVQGAGELIDGFELALYGMRPGDDQTIRLSPEQAFGPSDPALVRPVPRAIFDGNIDPEVGLVIAFKTEQGSELAGTVVALEGELVKVDLNHPLAGQEVIFRALILDVEPPPIEPDSVA